MVAIDLNGIVWKSMGSINSYRFGNNIQYDDRNDQNDDNSA